jgi:hypothetical protein
MVVVISAVVVGQLIVVAAILWFKTNASLRLSQPQLLALFVLAGAFATASSYLMLPLSDNFCRFREPLILLSINGMGNILAGRLWRSSVLMSPILKVGRGAPRTRSGETRSMNLKEKMLGGTGDRMRSSVMECMLFLSDWESLVSALRCSRCGSEAHTNNWCKAQKRNFRSIRQKIPLPRMIFLTTVMEVPQFILQLCNLLISSLKSSQTFEPQPVVAGVELLASACSRTSGSIWSTIVGIILAAIPFLLTICLAWWSKELPRAFNESVPVKSSAQLFLLVALIAGPACYLATTPDAKVRHFSMSSVDS